MKKTMVLCMILCSLLCGCQTHSANTEQPTATLDQNMTPPSTTDKAPLTDATDTAIRLAYYEELVGELRRELLDLKTQLYTTRVEYEARIDELTQSKPSQDPSPPQNSEDLPTQSQPVFQYQIKNGGAVITAYLGTDSSVTVPEQIDGLPIYAIGDRAFMDNRTLTSVTLPAGITEIGWFAFSGCIALEKINLPVSVTSVCYGAFLNCSSTLTVSCTGGSYGEQYARSYGIRTQASP